MYSDVAVIIPARIGSQRLKEKPLQKIDDKTIIELMLKAVLKTNVDNIYVATDSTLIAEKVENYGGKFIITDPACASGTDRVYEALKLIPNNKNFKYIINVQGDMPFISPKTILSLINFLKNSDYKLVTAVAKVGIDIAHSESSVKVVTDNNNKALYFSRRLIPYGAEEFLYHIGIYGFEVETLKTFVNLKDSSLEKNEKLEQLRALENGIDIGICYVEDVPLSIDTPEDLNKAKEFYMLNKES